MAGAPPISLWTSARAHGANLRQFPRASPLAVQPGVGLAVVHELPLGRVPAQLAVVPVGQVAQVADGHRAGARLAHVEALEPNLLATTIKHAEAIVSPHSAIILFPIDGALNKLPEDHSAVGNRSSVWVLNITASWEKAEDDKANIEWARTAWRDMRRFSTGGTYINLLTEDEGDERIHAAYGNNYDRLVELKSKWDPGNLFHMNKNIPPSR